MTPALSIVVAATDSPEAVARLLESFDGPAEIIVVEGESVPRLRRIGLDRARGRIVAFTEDSCVLEPGWVQAWLEAFADPGLIAATGLVSHESGSAVEWAVVFCEYAPFLGSCRVRCADHPREVDGEKASVSVIGPIADGPRSGPYGRKPPSRLAGNNFAVLRDFALDHGPTNIHESTLLDAVQHAGGMARTVETAVVRHVRRFGLARGLLDRFRFGHEFGRLRGSTSSTLARRLAWLLGPAVWMVQVARLTRIIAGNPRLIGRFVHALPFTLAMLAAWSLGESIGWATSRPGRKRRETSARPPSRRAGQRLSKPLDCTPVPLDA